MAISFFLSFIFLSFSKVKGFKTLTLASAAIFLRRKRKEGKNCEIRQRAYFMK